MRQRPRVCDMGPAVAVLLGFGLVVVCTAVFEQEYSQGNIAGEELEEAFFGDNRMVVRNTGRLNGLTFLPDSWLQTSSLALQTGRGNKVHKHSRMPSLRVGLKVLLLAVVVPALLAVVLYAAWKGVTLALLSLIISTIIGLKNLFSGHHTKHQDDITYTHNVIVAKNPAFQEHLWKRDMPLLAHAIDSSSGPYRVIPATGLSSTV